MRPRSNAVGEVRCSCSPTPSWTTRRRSTWTTNLLGKSKKGGPSSPRGGTSSPAANWLDTFQGKQICRRFQTGACTSPKCKYLHVCAIKGCHQAHPAKEHPSNRT